MKKLAFRQKADIKKEGEMYDQMGSLFDERTCELLAGIVDDLDDADKLMQTNQDKARIRIAHARATAHAAYILLRPAEPVAEAPRQSAGSRFKTAVRKVLP